VESVKLKSGAVEMNISPAVVTMRNYDKFQDWRKRIAAAGQTSSKQLQLMLKVLERIPELGEMIQPSGAFKAEAIEKVIRERAEQGLVESVGEAGIFHEAAIDEAKNIIQTRLIALAVDSPDVARALFFPEIEISATPETMELGRECILDTANLANLAPEQFALLSQELASDFWQEVEMKGVADYCNLFCRTVSPD